MPKEIIVDGEQKIGVHWYNFHLEYDEYVEPLVGVSIDVGEPFVMDGQTFNALYFNFSNPEDVERHIRALRRAKRKVFGSGGS
jgi:hypothetical protein